MSRGVGPRKAAFDTNKTLAHDGIKLKSHEKPWITFANHLLFLQIAGYTTAERFHKEIECTGIGADDVRKTRTMARLNILGNQAIDSDLFAKTIGEELTIRNKIPSRQPVITDWPEFCSDINKVFHQVALETNGWNAN